MGSLEFIYYFLFISAIAIAFLVLNGIVDSRKEEDIIIELREIRRDAEEETERIDKALYKIQMSIADKDKFNLVRKRYEESLRHKEAMEEINKEG